MNRSAARSAQSKKAAKHTTTTKAKKTVTKSAKRTITTKKRSSAPTPLLAPQHPLTTSQSSFSTTIKNKKRVAAPPSTSSFSTTTTPLTTRFASFATNSPYTPQSSKYLNWINAPAGLHWRDVVEIFQAQGFSVKADQDASAPTFYRVKFADFDSCRDAYKRLNGFTPPGLKTPLELKMGRSFRTEGTVDDLVIARLNIISGPANLAWTVVKDALQAYTPVLSVDQISASTYKIRLYTRTDFDYILMNLAKKRVSTPIGHEIVFEIRPWVQPERFGAPTTAQKTLMDEWATTPQGALQTRQIARQLDDKQEKNAEEMAGQVPGEQQH